MGHSGRDSYSLMYFRLGRISWRTGECVVFCCNWDVVVLEGRVVYVLILVVVRGVVHTWGSYCLKLEPTDRKQL